MTQAVKLGAEPFYPPSFLQKTEEIAPLLNKLFFLKKDEIALKAIATRAKRQIKNLQKELEGITDDSPTTRYKRSVVTSCQQLYIQLKGPRRDAFEKSNTLYKEIQRKLNVIDRQLSLTYMRHRSAEIDAIHSGKLPAYMAKEDQKENSLFNNKRVE